MPEILNIKLYTATYNIAKDIIDSEKRGQADHSFVKFVHLNHGQYLYRYGSAKTSNGAFEGARKIWTPVEKDKGNRWTGSGLSGPRGQLGLYTTLEADKCKNTLFAELFHYLGAEEGSNNKIDVEYHDFAATVIEYNKYIAAGEKDEYYKYVEENSLKSDAISGVSGVKPRPEPVAKKPHKALKLHYMFAFTLAKPIRLIDLQLPVTYRDPNSFAAEVFRIGTQIYPDLFKLSPHCIDLYMHGKDASFCRAIGNAWLTMVGVDGLLVTSARDTRSTSVILKGPVGVDFDFLNFAGRSSFFINPEGRYDEPAQTIADQMYNDKHLVLENHPAKPRVDVAKNPLKKHTRRLAFNWKFFQASNK
jgi:hypothetical protein